MALRTPEFLQTKTYSAMRDRLVLQHGGAIQPGTWDMTDFVATQRASSANMSVDVSAGYAIVAANNPGNAGYYHVQSDATFNAALQTNGASWAVGNGTNPRVDILVLLVTDTTDGGDTSDGATVAVVQGTPTAGATLDNRNGAAVVPPHALHLADVLIPAAASTVTTANIRDRRASARRGWFRLLTSQFGATTATFGSITPMTIWGEVDHLEVRGRIRSLRAGVEQTGCRFRVNGIATGYGTIGGVDNATPVPGTFSATWGYVGQIAAATTAYTTPTTIKLELPYINRIDGLQKHTFSTCVGAFNSGAFANERAATFLPVAFNTQRLAQLDIMDDVSSSLDPSSGALELWVFGG